MSIKTAEELKEVEARIESCPVCDGTGTIDCWESYADCTRCYKDRIAVINYYHAKRQADETAMRDRIAALEAENARLLKLYGYAFINLRQLLQPDAYDVFVEMQDKACRELEGGRNE